MKILFIPYGTDQAPATRYRVTQYLPHLEARNVEYSVFSSISKFSTSLMIKSPDFAPLTRLIYYAYVFIERLFRFFYILAISRKFDILFLQRTTFPFKLELLLKLANRNIIFDIDDAIYLPDKEGKDIITRIKQYVKKTEVISILRISRAIIVENEYIKNFVSQYCNYVYKIPGPIDTERFFVKKREDSKKGVTLGWIGSPATTSYLHMLDSAFRDIKKRYDFVKFKFIGLGKYENREIKFENAEWNYDTEVSQLQSFDIGIMPMPDNEWTRGKLGCKMLQYMAVGVPAVVPYSSTNAEIIKNGENGFFATKESEWTEILSILIKNEELRRAIGQKGRDTVLEKCSLSRNISKLIDIFSNIMSLA